MGFFDFVKSAGKKLGFGDDDEENAKELKKELDSHDLGTDAVQVEVKGDTAIIKGAVEDHSIFEKAVVAVGNTLSISKVEASVLKIADAPANDPAFVSGVAEVVARHRLRVGLALSGALAVALGAVTWAIAPAMDDLGGVLTTPGLPVAALVVALGAFGPKLVRGITRLAPTRS